RISFNHCQGMTLKLCTLLSKNKLHLKKFELTGSRFITNLSLDQTFIIIPLITMWGSTLEVLHLDKLSQEIANTLIIHCSNLKEFVISNSSANSVYLIYTFLKQSSLKSLHIDWYRASYEHYLNLVPNLPTTLTFLGLNTNFSELEFENFVKYCGKFLDLKTLTIKRL
ncbi:2542_t:CDS:1, partial [Dentiscutata heterogama]